MRFLLLTFYAEVMKHTLELPGVRATRTGSKLSTLLQMASLRSEQRRLYVEMPVQHMFVGWDDALMRLAYS